MALTLRDLEQIRDALLFETVSPDHALEIVYREISRMEQDQLLTEAGANPT